MRSGVLWVFPKTWSNRVKPPFLSGLAPQFLNIMRYTQWFRWDGGRLGIVTGCLRQLCSVFQRLLLPEANSMLHHLLGNHHFRIYFLSKNSSPNQCAHHKVWTSKHLTSQDQHVQLASPCLRARRRSPGWATDTHHTWEFTAPKSKHLFTPSHFFHEARIHLKQLQQSTIKQRNSK